MIFESFAIFIGEHLCWTLILINLKRDSMLVFFCKYCKNLKNRFFIEHLQWLLLKAKQNATKECTPCNTLWCLSCQLIIAKTTFGSIETKERFCIYHKVSIYENAFSAKFSKSESRKILFWQKIKITTERIESFSFCFNQWHTVFLPFTTVSSSLHVSNMR